MFSIQQEYLLGKATILGVFVSFFLVGYVFSLQALIRPISFFIGALIPDSGQIFSLCGICRPMKFVSHCMMMLCPLYFLFDLSPSLE